MNVVLKWIANHWQDLLGVILGAFFTALFQNVDKVRHLLRSPSSKPFTGKWVGVGKEYDHQTDAYVIGNDSFDLREKSFKDGITKITGEITTASAGVHREWDTYGKYYRQGTVLVLDYEATDGRESWGTYVLKGKPEAGVFKGYWLGYDADKRKLVAGPYILARDNSAFDKTWLNQPPYES
jgi:hypothetical protein